MKVRNTVRVCSMLLAASLTSAGWAPVRAQEQDHAVSSGQLRQDVQKATETRQANEAAVRGLLTSEKGREVLKSAGIDYQRVDQAISQASDEDLARMAERSRDVH